MTDIKRPRVYLDVSIAGTAAGRLTIELFVDKTPKTCENFRQLCTSTNPSLNYAQTPIHRIIDEFMIQGGDIPNGDRTGVASIYNDGKEFEDENLKWRELDERGLVCSANHGPDTNGSQFFILLEQAPHLNGVHTCFGRLVDGDELLQRLSKVEVDDEDRPKEAVVITRCGELERKTKAPTATSTSAEQPNGEDLAAASDERSRESSARGRKRKSDESTQAEKADAPEAAARKRRQSDNVLDEGLRGRPKQRSRSHSRSVSAAIEEEEDSGSQSRAPARHKRKRSQSPSRHMDRRGPRNGSGEDDRDRRRRKSLPNQYHDERDLRQGRRGQDSYRPSGRREEDRYGGGDRNGNWVRDDGRGGFGYDGRGARDYHQGYRNRGHRYERRPRQNYDEGRLGHVDEGRLGGPREDRGGGDDEPAVQYKGRGAMKYRER